jgi:hypothetical protein
MGGLSTGAERDNIGRRRTREAILGDPGKLGCVSAAPLSDCGAAGVFLLDLNG